MAKKDFWDYNAREQYNDYGDKDPYTRNSSDVNMDMGAQAALKDGVGAFLAKVFGWMFLGLLLTAGAAFAFLIGIGVSPAIARIASNPIFMFALIIAELIAVMGISMGIKSMSAQTATLLFLLYSALNGVTLSYIAFAYTGASIAQAFIMAALFFGVMAVYGNITKSDLSRFGPILFAALIALIVMSLINMFIGSGTLDYILCLVGLGIFAGLTAYDVQKIKQIYYGAAAGGGAIAQKLAIIGALSLYLDFINMFLYLLRIMGKKK